MALRAFAVKHTRWVTQRAVVLYRRLQVHRQTHSDGETMQHQTQHTLQSAVCKTPSSTYRMPLSTSW